MQGSTVWETRTDEQLLNEYKEDHFNKVVPHEACWDLNQRGGVGETPFQILYLVDSPESHAVGEILLRLYPKLSLDVYEGEEYFGRFYVAVQLVIAHILYTVIFSPLCNICPSTVANSFAPSALNSPRHSCVFREII